MRRHPAVIIGLVGIAVTVSALVVRREHIANIRKERLDLIAQRREEILKATQESNDEYAAALKGASTDVEELICKMNRDDELFAKVQEIDRLYAQKIGDLGNP